MTRCLVTVIFCLRCRKSPEFSAGRPVKETYVSRGGYAHALPTLFFGKSDFPGQALFLDVDGREDFQAEAAEAGKEETAAALPRLRENIFHVRRITERISPASLPACAEGWIFYEGGVRSGEGIKNALHGNVTVTPWRA